jgi:uncharacterized SAM-binding protein YcdF (DUF218 family)
MIRRLLAILALVYVLGFVLFMVTLPRPLDGTQTDAIVVLTGGVGRIDRGLALIRNHQAKRMLISGAGAGVRPIDLALKYKVPVTEFTCCVDIGHEAVDTTSNARETAKWVADHGYKSVRLVTSDWHMARARMELEAELPDDVTVAADGVQADAALGPLVIEYNKLLLRRLALWFGISS